MKTNAILLAASALAQGGYSDPDALDQFGWKEAPDVAALLAAHTKSVEKALEGFQGDTAELKAALTEVEQKLARRGGGDGRFFEESRTGTWGEQFAKNAGLKSFENETSRPGRFRVEMKAAITSAQGSGDGVAAFDVDDTVLKPQRRLTIRDLLTVRPVSSGTVEFASQTTRTNNADVVAETMQKPESAYAFEIKSVPIRTIAHWIPASRQILSDAPQLQGMIDTELRYGLQLKEEAQLLKGDGTGQNIAGLIPAAAAYAPMAGLTATNRIDQIGLAILQCAMANLPADGVVLHPADWMALKLLKDAAGGYILGDPGKDVPPILFGKPVVETAEMTYGQFLVGGFKAAATLYDRWEARVEVSTEHADFFTRNLVAILAEERIGLALKQAQALTYGKFN